MWFISFSLQLSKRRRLHGISRNSIYGFSISKITLYWFYWSVVCLQLANESSNILPETGRESKSRLISKLTVLKMMRFLRCLRINLGGPSRKNNCRATFTLSCAVLRHRLAKFTHESSVWITYITFIAFIEFLEMIENLCIFTRNNFSLFFFHESLDYFEFFLNLSKHVVHASTRCDLFGGKKREILLQVVLVYYWHVYQYISKHHYSPFGQVKTFVVGTCNRKEAHLTLILNTWW